VLRSPPVGVLVVILLGALWAWILVPGALRARRESSPIDSVDLFERSMSVLASNRTLPGRHVLVLDRPAQVTGRSTRARTLQRRRLVLTRLGAAVPLTLLAAIAFGGVWVAVFALTAAALAVYLGVLVQLRGQAQERRRKVRRLPVAPPREIVLDDADVRAGVGS
jgi:hypothetical protein